MTRCTIYTPIFIYYSNSQITRYPHTTPPEINIRSFEKKKTDTVCQVGSCGPRFGLTQVAPLRPAALLSFYSPGKYKFTCNSRAV